MSETAPLMDLDEAIDLGLLQELNRRILHPMGLALEVKRTKAGKATGIVGIRDNRASPVGTVYAPHVDRDVDEGLARRDRFEELHASKRAARKNALGFFVQPVETMKAAKPTPAEIQALRRRALVKAGAATTSANADE